MTYKFIAVLLVTLAFPLTAKAQEQVPLQSETQSQEQAPKQDQAPVQTETQTQDQAPVQTETQSQDQAPKQDQAPVQTETQTQEQAPKQDQVKTEDQAPKEDQVQTQTKMQDQAPTEDQVLAARSYLPAQDTYDIFVLGDSLAGGLYAGMGRLAQGDQELKVGGRFKEDSGIARPEFYDWNEAVPKILESNHVDIAVILIGGNDAQAMSDGAERLEFGTPQWSALYAREVDRLINTLKQGGTRIYWVSLPPMAAPSYNASIAQIAEIQKRQAEAASVRYVDIRAALTDPDGKMMVRGPDDTGDLRKLRDNDGIHFMKVGNNKIGKLLLDTLRADIELARTNKATPEGVAVVTTDEITGDQEVGGLLPESSPVDGTHPMESGKSDAGAAGKTDLVLRGPIAQPVVESPAARLFKLGEAPPAVPGRFDDFSYKD